jgi:hypothetical protein
MAFEGITAALDYSPRGGHEKALNCVYSISRLETLRVDSLSEAAVRIYNKGRSIKRVHVFYHFHILSFYHLMI